MNTLGRISTFKLQQVAQQVARLGKLHIFYRYKKNSYKEVTSEIDKTIQIHGIFHTQKTRVERPTNDTTVSRTKDAPMLLVTYEDYKAAELQHKDRIRIGEVDYELLDATNIGELNVAIDISLGELQ